MNIKNLRKEINENKQLLTAMGIYINELEDRLKKNGYMSERIMQLRTNTTCKMKIISTCKLPILITQTLIC